MREGGSVSVGRLQWVNLKTLKADQFKTAIDTRANLQKAHLKEAVFSSPDSRMYASLLEVNLQEANLEGVDLRGVDLRNLDFRTTNLSKAHLENANLSKAVFQGANLSEAHLENADLSEAILQGANLSWAHLERAKLDETVLEGVDLNTAYLEEEPGAKACTLQVALRNSKLFKKSKPHKVWSTEIIYDHTYSNTVIENEDGTVAFDRIFTDPHPYEWGERVYRCANETFSSIENFISHIQVNEATYLGVRPDEKIWLYHS